MSLPPPALDQPHCNVSALEAGFIRLPLDRFLQDGKPGEDLIVPSLSFLVRHSKTDQNFLFDLGIRKDQENYPPPVLRFLGKDRPYRVMIEHDVCESLAKGNLSPSDIDTVCLSHLHWDHVGDPERFANSTFLVGGSAKSLVTPGYPENQDSHFATDLLPNGRTKFLDLASCPSLGPFPRALDFYGDGSLYVIDAAGHLPGHVNLLVRTSDDGGWLLLAGDSAHHWRLVTGESKIAVTPHYCAHMDLKAAEENIERMRTFMKLPRTRLILAHDEPWYEKNKNGEAFWPGRIPSM